MTISALCVSRCFCSLSSSSIICNLPTLTANELRFKVHKVHGIVLHLLLAPISYIDVVFVAKMHQNFTLKFTVFQKNHNIGLSSVWQQKLIRQFSQVKLI